MFISFHILKTIQWLNVFLDSLVYNWNIFRFRGRSRERAPFSSYFFFSERILFHIFLDPPQRSISSVYWVLFYRVQVFQWENTKHEQNITRYHVTLVTMDHERTAPNNTTREKKLIKFGHVVNLKLTFQL